MFARWKAAALTQRRRVDASDSTTAACTPPPQNARTSQRMQQLRKRRESSASDADRYGMDVTALSDRDSDVEPSAPLRNDWRKQTLLQRVVAEKNRLVQRTLVALKLAEASKDMYFKKKLLEYEQAIAQLQETKEIVELYAQSLLDLSIAIRGFAGNASDVRRYDQDDSLAFLVAAETIEEKGFEFMEEVRERVVRSLEDRIVDLQHVSELLRERGNLQIDVDYAKRMLIVAKQRGDVNVIADKKKALQIAQLRRKDATKQIAQLLSHYDNKQEIEFDLLISEFACIAKTFFKDGALLLRGVEPFPRRRFSNATFLSSTSGLDTLSGDRDPIAV